ncbi:MAG: polyprenol monophosphomannose synthase [Chloroflexi bacterium]|nr:MAG: polyprenol monophosphomannose synthase [Chloroflexota bacterium]MBL1197464.1 polyprenol monophosphomannose synthase [Chloroflexota bacterium]NOH14759.1 polyprenol monophosphomannose synthase [Chloroflexota bacterium]
MQLTIVLPTYNEAENLPILVPALFDLPLPDLKLLIVDDGSPDGTGQLAEQLGEDYPGRIHVHHRSGKLGLGTAYITGFKLALNDGAEAIGQMDSDFSHPVEKVPELMDALEGADVAQGCRWVKGGGVDENWPLWRRALSRWGSLYSQAILRVPMRDVTGGFRVWRRETLEQMQLDRIRASGYMFQIEITYMAHRLGFNIAEVPFYFPDRQLGESKMSGLIALEASLRVWQALWRYRDLKPIMPVAPSLHTP